MKMNKDEQMQNKIRQTLDRQSVDANTRAALQAARQDALDGEIRHPAIRWAPATALAALVLTLSGLVVLDLVRDDGFPEADADDLAVIASEDEFELYEELEFFAWFDEDQQV